MRIRGCHVVGPLRLTVLAKIGDVNKEWWYVQA